MGAPEITANDFVRFLTEHGFGTDVDPNDDGLDIVKEWMEESGVTAELIEILGASFQGNFGMRLLCGESLSSALFNMGLTAFQVGWLASKEFGRREP